MQVLFRWSLDGFISILPAIFLCSIHVIIIFQVLFKNANLTVERGEKLAILGPNGCGKSTLLKLIMGMVKPDRGEVLLGEHNVLPNYFEQNQECFCYFPCLSKKSGYLSSVFPSSIWFKMPNPFCRQRHLIWTRQ